MPYATDSSLTISNYAVKAAVALFKPGIKYKKAGVIVSGLVPTNEKQLDLFLSENPKHHKLMKVMDGINDKYGIQKMKIAKFTTSR